MNRLSMIAHPLTLKMVLEPRKTLVRALLVLLVQTHLRPASAKKEVAYRPGNFKGWIGIRPGIDYVGPVLLVMSPGLSLFLCPSLQFLLFSGWLHS